MKHRIHICSFSSTDDIKGKHLTYENIRAKVLEAGRFSIFEATETPKRAKLFMRLQKDPTLIVDNSPGYPWISVKLR